jgi:hypothetical protein
MEPVPDLRHSFHLFSCLFGIHLLFLLCELWSWAMVIAPFSIYGRKKPFGLTADQGKRWESRNIAEVEMGSGDRQWTMDFA